MWRRIAKRYTASRDEEVWARIRDVWPVRLLPFAPVGWLHAYQLRDPARPGGPVRGLVLGANRILFFDAGEWMDWYPLVRLVGLDWLEDYSEFSIEVADPTESGVAHKYTFELSIPGQESTAGRLLCQKFISSLVDVCQARGQITDDDLWPSDGSPGIGLEEAPR